MSLLNENENILDDDIMNELNKITNNNLKKRIARELLQFKKLNAYIHIELSYYTHSYKIIISIMFLDENDLYKFEISNDYPFRPPTNFTINYKPYKNYLFINSPKTKNELKIYEGIDCLCCNNINCASMWSPSLTMLNHIEEYKKCKKIRRNIIIILIAKKIINKYLISDIDLMKWLM